SRKRRSAASKITCWSCCCQATRAVHRRATHRPRRPSATALPSFRDRSCAPASLESGPVSEPLSAQQMPNVSILSGQGVEEMDLNFNLPNLLGGKSTKKKKASIKRARQLLMNEEIDRLVDWDLCCRYGLERRTGDGIVFLDELDKIASRGGRNGVDVSREGVQGDILPIIEGGKVTTRHGVVDTTHILFNRRRRVPHVQTVGSDPRTAGALPIRVELHSNCPERTSSGSSRNRRRLDQAVHRAARDRGSGARFHPGCDRAHFRSRVRGELEHSEYRRASAAHDTGAHPRRGLLPRVRRQGTADHGNRPVRGRTARRHHRRSGPDTIHPVAWSQESCGLPRRRQVQHSRVYRLGDLPSGCHWCLITYTRSIPGILSPAVACADVYMLAWCKLDGLGDR
ncbi:ATP-dependent protease ATPase subunit HslU, partial [Geodia barretti]